MEYEKLPHRHVERRQNPNTSMISLSPMETDSLPQIL